VLVQHPITRNYTWNTPKDYEAKIEEKREELKSIVFQIKERALNELKDSIKSESMVLSLSSSGETPSNVITSIV